MRAQGRSFVGAAIGVALLAHACGREDIQLQTADGGARDASAAFDAHAPGDGSGPQSGEDSGPVCGPAPTCLAIGASCGSASDCCSQRCEGSVCLDQGSCSGAGALCENRDECCSGRCDPEEGSLSAKCAPYCLVDGTACKLASDCCSLACNGGTCGGATCAVAGDSCSQDSDCCSGDCEDTLGTCLLSATLCRVTGEGCGAGTLDVPPCCGSCDDDGRCGFGPGQCLPRGAPCGSDDTCCNGSCVAGDGGVTVCTSACSQAGATCTTNDDCCSGACGGVPLTCKTSSSPCKLAGATCTTGGECCTGSCVKGQCGCD